MDGKSWGVLGLIRDHRAAVEYDLSTRFSGRFPKGLRSAGETVTLWELARLVEILRSDPSSAIAAALEGWDFPISREALALYDLFDLTVQANTDPKKGRPKPHPGRPYSAQRPRERHGNAAGLDPAEVKKRLAAMAGRPDPPV